MRCKRCGHRVVSGADIDAETRFTRLLMVHDEFYYAVDSGGRILGGGVSWCAPDQHVVRYEPDEVAAAARGIVRLLMTESAS